MAVKETAAQRKTRVAMLLADLKNRSEELNKLTTVVKGLKEQVREIDPGTYGDWVLSLGASREIMDQKAVRKYFTDNGVDMPTTMTEPSRIVTPKTK
jgi:hypothetical protein